MEAIALELLGTLKIFGQLWKHKLEREWEEDIEKLEKRLWAEKNKPDMEKDGARIVNILEDIKRKNKKAQSFMLKIIAERNS